MASHSSVRITSLLILPGFLVASMLVYAALWWLAVPQLGTWVLLIAVAVGSFQLVIDTLRSLWQRRFALDYVALAAISTGVLTGDYLVAAVICLMLSGGNALEEYAQRKAESSLKALAHRIPDQVQLWENDSVGRSVSLSSVVVGATVAVRRGEVVPLDGILVSAEAAIDESSLTGEPYPVEKEMGDQLKSGTVNSGNLLVLRVTHAEKDSSYKKIVALVNEAQQSKSPLIRLADRYSAVFTVVTFLLAALTYFFTNDPERVLAVLVLATPCPLILATPIALIGGLNAAARKGMIVKNLGSIEALSRVTALIFDKTGTITLGELQVLSVEAVGSKMSQKELLSIAASIERSSLHPIAKAIVKHAHAQKIGLQKVLNVEEKIGVGISAAVYGVRYTLKSQVHKDGIAVSVQAEGKKVGSIFLQDTLKKDSRTVMLSLQDMGLSLHLLSGDTVERVSELVEKMDLPVQFQAGATPKEKMSYIKKLQHAGQVTAMVGDGINDAPALATADTGIVFSNEEQSAASNAADIVLLGNKLGLVRSIIGIARDTIRIALQSIWVGLGLSIIGMILASFGYIPPLVGALSQEVIDVLVIVNALRASRLKG